MPSNLPPPPVRDEGISTFLRDWLSRLYDTLGGVTGTVPWDNVNKSGSNLSEIQTRLHSDLQNLSADDHTQYVLADGTRNITGQQEFEDNIVLPKTSGKGILVDTVSPTYGWKDLIGRISIRGLAFANDPNAVNYRGTLKQFQFAVNDEVEVEFHIPHDYAPGTDIHLHFHWSHNATTVTGGSVTWGAEVSYAKGHNQAPFSAPVTFTVAQNASTTQYQHMIAEGQLSASSPSASQIDTDNLEPDGLILVRIFLSANNLTVSAGGIPEPFLHFADIHYQSTQTATKQKAPNFYT